MFSECFDCLVFYGVAMPQFVVVARVLLCRC